jgi:hypothetical protein
MIESIVRIDVADGTPMSVVGSKSISVSIT